MKVSVRFFAILKDRAGMPEVTVDLPGPATVATVVGQLAERYPAMATDLHRVAYAINRSYVKRDAVLSDGDELALIPPVSGGCE